MKKVMLFLMVIIASVACSDNDDTDKRDLVIGTWGKISIIESGVITTLDKSNPNNQIVINENGTLNFLGTNTSAGTWMNLGKGNYKIENIVNGITFSTNYKIEFTSASQMKWSNSTSVQIIYWDKLN